MRLEKQPHLAKGREAHEERLDDIFPEWRLNLLRSSMAADQDDSFLSSFSVRQNYKVRGIDRKEGQPSDILKKVVHIRSGLLFGAMDPRKVQLVGL